MRFEQIDEQCSRRDPGQRARHLIDGEGEIHFLTFGSPEFTEYYRNFT
jgi:hypothetical protein